MDIDIHLQELKKQREASAFYKNEMKKMVERVKQSNNYEVAETGKRKADEKIAELEEVIRGAALKLDEKKIEKYAVE